MVHKIRICKVIGKITYSSLIGGCSTYILKEFGIVHIGDLRGGFLDDTVGPYDHYIRPNEKYKVTQLVRRKADGEEEVMRSSDTNLSIEEYDEDVVLEYDYLGMGNVIWIKGIITLNEYIEARLL